MPKADAIATQLTLEGAVVLTGGVCANTGDANSKIANDSSKTACSFLIEVLLNEMPHGGGCRTTLLQPGLTREAV
jgi:hypothetical protein